MSFGTLASIYRGLETLSFGGKLQFCRCVGLDWLPAPRHALIVGEGDGRFLVAFLKRFPHAKAHVVDASPEMLARARNRVRATLPLELERVEFQCACLPEDAPDQGPYDLLVTHFFLDCFDSQGLEDLLPLLDGCLTQDASWLHSDFRVPERGWPRFRARLWLAVMYRFFAWTTSIQARDLEDPIPRLEHMGWICRQSVRSDRDFLETSLWTRSSGRTVGTWGTEPRPTPGDAGIIL